MRPVPGTENEHPRVHREGEADDTWIPRAAAGSPHKTRSAP